MKTKELNLCEILKNCPKGTKLYSPIYGFMRLHSVRKESDNYPISMADSDNCLHTFHSDGRIYLNAQAECCLFPSKDNRDWSTFKPKKERFDPKTLKPLDIYISNSKKNKNMKLNEYQEKAQETANYSRPNQFLAISYCSLGLTGEAGEVANKVKKILRDDNGVCNPEKHEGWINIYNGNGYHYIGGNVPYSSKSEAIRHITKELDYVATCKIEWEE